MSIEPLYIAEPNALAAAALWIAGAATGTVATGVATIAVAAVGFSMLAGRTDVRRGVTVIFGCFILFAAPTIASAFSQWAGGGGEPIERTAFAEPLPAVPPPPPPSSNDPYAGASLIR